MINKIIMLRRFICCFKSNIESNERNSVVSLNKRNDKNMDDICVSITDDTKYTSTVLASKINEQIEWKDTIPFVPPIEQGFVIKVYDGDTITIASKLPYNNSKLYRFQVRLNGIDCPEMKGKEQSEKECAEIAKQEMTNLVMNKVVTLKNVQTEKYGRILADVYVNDLHVNKDMIQKRLAVTYDGGTKVSPKNWMNYYYTGEL